MNKIYLVVEYGGEYDDKWERVIAACTTSELADILKNKSEERHYSPISKEDVWDAEDQYYNQYPEDEEIDYEKLSNTIYPVYPAEVWKNAFNLYMDFEWVGTTIREVDLINDTSEISNFKWS